jgi:pimeloyl-ACP methyl ester carboxylesterase
MRAFRTILFILAIGLAWTIAAPAGRASGEPEIGEGVASTAAGNIPAGFAAGTARVNGTLLHYVMGGEGPPLILLHGFPQDWSTYAGIMPALARKFRVVAMDLRGIGGSPPTATGYDTMTMALDVYQLAAALDLEQPYVVGHDLGGLVAYALARLQPRSVRGIMVLGMPVAGIDPWDKVKNDPASWHIRFHQAPGLAENLMADRETIYLGYFLRAHAANVAAIGDADIARYAAAYRKPGQMQAAMEMYRALPAAERFGQEQRGPLDVPIALAAGDAPGKGMAALLPEMVRGLEQAGASPVTNDRIAGAGHYVLDEAPGDVAALIERYAGKVPFGPQAAATRRVGLQSDAE